MGIQSVKSILSFNHAAAFADEVKDRRELVARLLYTGIKQLDFVFNGIMPNDLVLVGAATGSGKTELLTQIACNVAESGKYVDMFALEASKYEIHRRIKFKIYSKLLWLKQRQKINFAKWMRFEYEDLLADVADEANEKLDLLSKFLRVHYRPSTFDLSDFMKLYNYFAKDSNLMLCDHAQFFDFDENVKSDNAHTKDMTLKMYDLVNSIKVPIVLVSHLRKLDSEATIPDIYDFFGSSELAKKATRVLLIKRYQYDREQNAWSTIFRFCKNRELDPRVLLTFFNSDLKCYSDEFQEGVISNDKFVSY